jgi:acetyl esterase
MLDPVAQKIIEAGKASGLAPVFTLPVEEARERMRSLFVSNEPPESVGAVVDTHIPCEWGNMGIRIYTPVGEGKFPVFVFFHGGGWVLNSIETHDSVCRRLTNLSDCIVISVDYRLAPEHKYPAAIEDAYAAVEWAISNADKINGDSAKIIVGGDSSGATQATVVCMMARDRGTLNICYQVLIYPPTDHYDPGTESYVENGYGYPVGKDFMVWVWNHYLPDTVNLDDPYVCPLRAKDFSGLPPAIVLTAPYDPLRDEGEAYARKLQDAGIEVDLKQYDGMMHGFIMQYRIMKQGAEALERIAAGIKKRFS